MRRHIYLLCLACAIVIPACTHNNFSPTTEDHPASTTTPYSQSLPKETPQDELMDEEGDLPLSLFPMDKLAPPVASFDEWYRAMTEEYLKVSHCMENRDWPMQIVSNPYSPQVGLDLQGWGTDPDKFVSDIRECTYEAGPIPTPPEPSVELAQQQYDNAVSATECFTALGVQMPPLPSKQKFIDDFLITRLVWSPIADENFLNSPAISGKSVTELYELCPW